VDEFYNLGYVKELAYVVDCVLQDRRPTYGASGELGLACAQIVEAMYRSASAGKTIKGEW
jgi:predicted dehydrogenase